MNPLTFFAHVALSADAEHLSPCGATANLLIEVDDETLQTDQRGAHLDFSQMSNPGKVDYAATIGRAAAFDFLDLEREFNELLERRFVDFNLTVTPTYISVRPPPTRTPPNNAKVWRLAKPEADKLRTEPRS